MMSRVERFNQRARRILTAAQEEAESSHSPTIDTPHILLGILRNTDSVACRTLNDLRVYYDRVLPLVLAAHPGDPNPTKPVLTADSKRLIESATDIARQRGENYIGSEHFLLALVKGEDKSIRYLMRQINLEPQVVRSCVERVLKEHPEDLPQTKPLPDAEAAAAENGSLSSAEPNIRARVIKLVEDGKISAQEAAELLKAMRLAAVPLAENTGYVLLPLDSVNFDELRQRSVHVRLTDGTSNTLADLTLTLEQAQNEVFRLLRDAYRGEMGSLLEMDSPQGHITVTLE